MAFPRASSASYSCLLPSSPVVPVASATSLLMRKLNSPFLGNFPATASWNVVLYLMTKLACNRARCAGDNGPRQFSQASKAAEGAGISCLGKTLCIHVHKAFSTSFDRQSVLLCTGRHQSIALSAAATDAEDNEHLDGMQIQRRKVPLNIATDTYLKSIPALQQFFLLHLFLTGSIPLDIWIYNAAIVPSTRVPET